MSSELERRLEAMLAGVPEPDPGAGEKALARALSALRPSVAPRRGLRTAVLVFAAAVVLLAIAAGSLAAAGAIHVSFGAKKQRPPARAATQLSLPQGSTGIAALVDGRLSVVIRGGFRLQGLAVSAAALSPHARFVAAGIRHSLVTIAPDGRRPWTHATGGTVVTIAWAPDGLRIAYVVRTGRRLALHVIWGNGMHDTTIERSVRAVRPSWRADSLAFAYVGAGGKAIVYDLAHESRRLVAVRRPVTGVAFAPAGDSLAVARSDGVWLLHGSAAVDVRGGAAAFGWLHGRLAVAASGVESSLIRLFAPDGAARGSYRVDGAVVAVTPKHVVVRRRRNLFAGRKALLSVPRGTTVRDLAIG